MVTVACLGFCALVLATSFPVSALMRQHRQASAATAELRALTTGNDSLQQQASELSQPANIATLARQDYDLVRPGQKAYTVLPLPGSMHSSAASSGHSSLDQAPVAPGSAESEALLGYGGLNGAGNHGDSSPSTNQGQGQAQGQAQAQAGSSTKSAHGLWGRVLDTLEILALTILG